MAEGHGIALHTEELETSQRSAEAIRRDIAARRDSISGTVDRLGDRLHETFDWRSYVSDYPFVALGVAAGLGLALSGVVRRRPTPSERIFEAISETVEIFLGGRLRANVSDVIPKKRSVGRSPVGAGLTGIAMSVASEWIKSQMRDTDPRQAKVNERNIRDARPRPISHDITERTEQLEEPPANSPWSPMGGNVVI